MTDLSNDTLASRIRRHITGANLRNHPEFQESALADLDELKRRADECKQDQGEGPPAFHVPPAPIEPPDDIIKIAGEDY